MLRNFEQRKDNVKKRYKSRRQAPPKARRTGRFKQLSAMNNNKGIAWLFV